MEKILKKALDKAGSAEVFFSDTRKVEVQYDSGKLKVVNSVRHTGAALRVISAGKLGFSSSTDLSKSDRLVDLAMGAAAAGPAANFTFPKPVPAAWQVETVKPSALGLGVSEIVEMGAKYVEKLKKLKPDCYPEVSISVEQEKSRILNSSGLDCEQDVAMYHVFYGATVVKGSDVLMVPSFSIPLEGEFDPEAAADQMAEKLGSASNICDASTRPTKVLFSPMGLDSLLLPLRAGFNGKAVEMGVSPIKSLMGKKALSEIITVWNDPTVRYWYRSGNVDNEGVPTQKTPLVDKGVIGAPYYDLLTADMYGKKSTGSGYKDSLEAPPSPGPSLISIAPGEASFTKLLESIDDGLFIDYCLGVGQGNFMAGEFSNNVGLGFKVKGGKIVGRVKNAMIAGNAYDILNSNVKQLSSERGFSMTMCLAPFMLIEGVSVTAK